MELKIAAIDDFESRYLQKFKVEASKYGTFINYDKDRAAIDLGLQLIKENPESSATKLITSVRIWFQLKGITSQKLPKEQFITSDYIKVNIDVQQLKFWYASPEPVYLAIYVESADCFLLEDVNEIVLRQFGEELFSPSTFREDQQTTTIYISRKNESKREIWEQMYFHRGIRIDGPCFRGRPLGHRLDPLRCCLDKLNPVIFESLIKRILEVHGYRISKERPKEWLYDTDKEDKVCISIGTLYHTYEWVCHLTTEFGYSVDTDFRIEGRPEYAFGKICTIILSELYDSPSPEKIKEASAFLKAEGISRVLVFVNSDEPAHFGMFFRHFNDNGIKCLPQLLCDIPYNLLTSTQVYLEYRDKIKWKILNYLQRKST